MCFLGFGNKVSEFKWSQCLLIFLGAGIGPVFGKITPYSTNGKAVPLVQCLMFYLFTVHAGHGGLIDDTATVDKSGPVKEFKNKLKMKIELPTEHPKPIHDGRFGAFPID